MAHSKISDYEMQAVDNLKAEIFTVKQVAYLFGITERTVMNYIKEGRIKGSKVGGKWRFTKAEIERLINEG